MRRRLRDGLAVAALDHPARVHHQGLVREVAGRRDVVGDVQDGQVQPLLEVAQQVQHAEADGNVQHGHRLIREQRLGVGAQCPGDGDALPLAAGEFVGELVEVALGRRHGDPGEQVAERPFQILGCVAGVVMDAQ
jgi:hypothetical protein